VTLFCATTNAGKIREFRLASSDAFAIEALPDMAAIPVCEETGLSFEANAMQKALYYGAHCDGFLFAEDSGLAIDALGGAPGIYSARFAGENATDEANNALVLERMRGKTERAARYVCVIALVRAGKLLETFQGHVEGEILDVPRGSGGFGYDPLFFYPPMGCSFGEAPGDAKQSVSHRGQAMKKMLRHLESHTLSL
jgi:XTP/dITP diphosphohydrolase